MSFGVWIEDGRKFGVERGLDMALQHDNVDSFVKKIDRLVGTPAYRMRGQEFLMKTCQYRAYKCASVLLNGVTPLIFDVNRPTPQGVFPIHHAAWNCEAGMIELLLHHGARTDVRAPLTYPDFRPYLPLHGVLHHLGSYLGDYEYKPCASVYQLVTLLCLECLQNRLECVELLAWSTVEVADEFLRYAREGKLLFLAALLAVARERLLFFTDPSYGPLYSRCCNLETSEDEKRKLSLLFEVFARAGDALEKYIKRNKNGLTVTQISNDVAVLLNCNGFAVSPIDTDLSSLYRGSFCPSFENFMANREEKTRSTSTEPDVSNLVDWRDKDVGMEHYGKSGHRWMTYGEPRNESEIRLNEPNKPSMRYEITEEEKRQLPTAVGKFNPIPIPCFVDTHYSPAQFIKTFKPMVS